MDNQSARFPDSVRDILKLSGWFPERSVEDLVMNWRRTLDKAGSFRLSAAAEKILLEFGGLCIDQHGPGQSGSREPIEIDPTLAINEDDRFGEFSKILGTRLSPLGEAYGGHYFLAVSEDGRVFLVMDDVQFLGENFDGALERLILGIKPQPIIE